MSLVEELMVLTGWDRTRCIEECVRIAAPELIKKFKAVSAVSEKVEGYEELSRAYMRRLVFGDLRKGELER